MKKTYEVDIEKVKENILLELGRYTSTKEGYSRDLFEHNIKQILEQGYKNIPTDFKQIND